MYPKSVRFNLPVPWKSESFELKHIGAINYLVGPNGSGKSRFADALKASLSGARILGTDRLEGQGSRALQHLYGDNFASGFRKAQFSSFKGPVAEQGSGIDAYVILEERPDIRVIVEATLSNLFNRKILLEWDSGNLVPKARLGNSSNAYRVDREECHGIRELLVLLTHLYYDQHPYLIIDEPELNLHPQFQAFFMQEVRKIAGQPVPGTRTKSVFLITHSPFIIDLRGMDDLISLVSFSSTHGHPTAVNPSNERLRERFVELIPRLNVHHKQLFFCDNPIFVEGIFDARLIEAIQSRRQVSIISAGSSLIDVGGSDEANKYLELCREFNKAATFLYDLDSLFTGTLRRSIGADGTMHELLATLGLGSDFNQYCGALDRVLTQAIEAVRKDNSSELCELREHVEAMVNKTDTKALGRARVAVLVELAAHRANLVNAIGDACASDIEGRLKQIVQMLRKKGVLLLKNGAIENHLPSYKGNRFELSDNAKRCAIEEEIKILSTGAIDDSLQTRYGDLYENIALLPGKPPINTDDVLLEYLGDYVHQLQNLILNNPTWQMGQLNQHFSSVTSGLGKLFKVETFHKTSEQTFTATISITEPEGRIVEISDDTNAGMRRFVLKARQ